MVKTSPATKYRLNQYLSKCGVASRRKADTLIFKGLVSVNGSPVLTPALTVTPQDQVLFRGKPISLPVQNLTLLLNKPAGYVTTTSDPHAPHTVFDLLPSSLHHLRYVGRLDKNTTGLLLLTTDGSLIQTLTHPSHKISKQYAVTISPPLPLQTLNRLTTGIPLDGRPTAPAKLSSITPQPSGLRFLLTIHEGRNRQIRRMCEYIGAKVRSLTRLRLGPLSIGLLPPGAYRPLTQTELDKLSFSKVD